MGTTLLYSINRYFPNMNRDPVLLCMIQQYVSTYQHVDVDFYLLGTSYLIRIYVPPLLYSCPEI